MARSRGPESADETKQVPERIVSFLPAATEILCALGLVDRVVGVTHECDHPPEIHGKPVVIRSAVALEGLSPEEIDARVRERLKAGASLYEADEQLLRELAPDLIVTQDLCQVCAPSGNEVSKVLKHLPRRPKILYLSPKSLDDILQNILEVGRVTGRIPVAEGLVARARSRLSAVRRRAATSSRRPRVFCMEWIDPIYCAGHWVPEMVKFAGGIDGIARFGMDSVRVPWEAVRRWAPEIIVLAPCGFHLEDVLDGLDRLPSHAGWDELPAVQQGRVYAVDASSYFARPGPRVVDGVELLAHLIHPERFPWRGSRQAYVAWAPPLVGMAPSP
jgi:iron complex transport system substrate-binding protein